MKSARKLLLVALFGVVSSVVSVGSVGAALRPASSTPRFTGSPVVIGQEICETGYLEETYGAGSAQLAAKLINQAGGVLGHKVEVQSLDTQCIATNEITDANQLIDQYHAVAILGGVQSAAVQGVIPTVEADHIPFIATGTLLQQAPWGVTIFPPVANVADTLIGFISKKFPKLKSMANISGNTPFGVQLQTDVQQYANAHGISTSQGEIANTATDTTPVLQGVSSTSMYFTNTSGAINLIEAENAQSLGWTKPLIFDDGLTTDLLAMQPKYTNGTVYNMEEADGYQYFAHDATMKALDAKLLKYYKKNGGKAINIASLDGVYDQMNLLVNAMKSAKTVTDGQKIENALTRESFNGAGGIYSFKPGYSFGLKGNPYDMAIATSATKYKVIYVPAAGY